MTERLADDHCPHEFPLPWWMGEDQDDRCQCDLGVGHTVPHSCSHLRGEKNPLEVEAKS